APSRSSLARAASGRRRRASLSVIPSPRTAATASSPSTPIPTRARSVIGSGARRRRRCPRFWERQAVRRYADVRAYTSQAPSRLEVVAGDEPDAIERPLGRGDVRRAVGLFARHFNLLCLD